MAGVWPREGSTRRSRSGTSRPWKPGCNLVGHTGEVKALAIAPQGGTIASAAVDSTLKLWRDGLPEAILTIDDYNGIIEHIRFSPDGSTLATCAKLSAKEYQVFLWPSAPRDGETASEMSPHRP